MSSSTVTPQQLKHEAELSRQMSGGQQHGYKLNQVQSSDLLTHHSDPQTVDTVNNERDNIRMSAVDASIDTRQKQHELGMEPIVGENQHHSGHDLSMPDHERQLSIEKQRAKEIEAELINGGEA